MNLTFDPYLFPTHSRNRSGIARESRASESGTERFSVGPYARAGARATRRVRYRRQETGLKIHPSAYVTGGAREPAPMDGRYAAEFGGGC